MFHVKHRRIRYYGPQFIDPQRSSDIRRDASASLPLFADAEVAEDHVQDVLDIDPAGEAPERAGGDAQLLGQQILTAGQLGAAARRRAARASSSARRWRSRVTSAGSAPARKPSA